MITSHSKNIHITKKRDLFVIQAQDNKESPQQFDSRLPCMRARLTSVSADVHSHVQPHLVPYVGTLGGGQGSGGQQTNKSGGRWREGCRVGSTERAQCSWAKPVVILKIRVSCSLSCAAETAVKSIIYCCYYFRISKVLVF